MDKPITIALPSGKSMEEPTLQLLKAAHIGVRRPHPRMCTAEVSGLPGITQAVFFKPSQIADVIASGDAALGITGQDVLLESGSYEAITHIVDLPYSRATANPTRCVVFAGKGVEVSIEALQGEQIISEYPRETRIFLERAGISATVVPCTGSAESFIAIGRYRYGVALTETGSSLQQNGFEEVAEIFSSQMVLIANKGLWTSDSRFRDSADFLGRLLWGVLEARGKVYLLMNAPSASVEKIRETLPALKSPTIQPLADPAFCSVASVVPTDRVNELKMRLMELGASGFVELDPGSVM